MDLEKIIEDSVREAEEDATLLEDKTEETSTEATDATESDVEDPDKGEVAKEEEKAPEAKVEASKAKPAEDKAKTEEDDFSKRIGIPAESAPGRENRIPYSRVKKIVEKAEKDAVARAEATLTPKVTEFETKVKEYETRLENVGKFEQIMFNDPKTFLDMLSTVPAYKEFFEFVRHAHASKLGIPAVPGQAATKTEEDPMPQPDENGGYSMKQLQSLMDWQARQVEKRVSARYAPIEQQWQAQQKIQQVMPEIQRQVAEARTWPLFADNEAEIIKALNADPNLTLDGAYRTVVIPKIQAERATVEEATRRATLEEVRRAGRSTSVSSRQTKPATRNPDEPRDLEEIIREAIANLN